jgi:hypothetical protein
VGTELRFLEKLYGRLRGVGAGQLDAAERRLGLKLPRALRTYYLKTGATRALHQRHNRLLSPRQLRVADDHLVFYEENQNVVEWGIRVRDLKRADPPVRQGQQHDDHWHWYPEFKSVSEFALAQGAWQAVMGGMRYVANRAGTKRPPKSLGAPVFENAGMKAWLIPGGVAVLAGGDFFAAGVRKRSELFRLGGDIDWDYVS